MSLFSRKSEVSTSKSQTSILDIKHKTEQIHAALFMMCNLMDKNANYTQPIKPCIELVGQLEGHIRHSAGLFSYGSLDKICNLKEQLVAFDEAFRHGAIANAREAKGLLSRQVLVYYNDFVDDLVKMLTIAGIKETSAKKIPLYH